MAPCDHQRSDSLMEDMNITYESDHKVSSALDGTSSPGPDGIHPMLLKECSDVLALPLSIIFRKSLSTGILPQLWKISRVSPIFKSGSRAEPLNYRPISLTSTCCKVMERLIAQHIMAYLERNDLMCIRQFGFRRGRSAEDQLLLTYGDVVRMVDDGQVVLIWFIWTIVRHLIW